MASLIGIPPEMAMSTRFFQRPWGNEPPGISGALGRDAQPLRQNMRRGSSCLVRFACGRSSAGAQPGSLRRRLCSVACTEKMTVHRQALDDQDAWSAGRLMWRPRQTSVARHPGADSLDGVDPPGHRLDVGAHPCPLALTNPFCQPAFDVVP